MTTNGIVLARKIKELKESGLNQLNISLDTLEEKSLNLLLNEKAGLK